MTIYDFTKQDAEKDLVRKIDRILANQELILEQLETLRLQTGGDAWSLKATATE